MTAGISLNTAPTTAAGSTLHNILFFAMNTMAWVECLGQLLQMCGQYTKSQLQITNIKECSIFTIKKNPNPREPEERGEDGKRGGRDNGRLHVNVWLKKAPNWVNMKRFTHCT